MEGGLTEENKRYAIICWSHITAGNQTAKRKRDLFVDGVVDPKFSVVVVGFGAGSNACASACLLWVMATARKKGSPGPRRGATFAALAG